MAKQHIFVDENGEIYEPEGVDQFGNQLPVHAINEDGEEVFDETPLSVPLRPVSHTYGLIEQVRHMIAGELSRRASDQGYETFEESDDFEVGDYHPRSPYELTLDQELEGGDNDFRPEGDVEASATNASGDASTASATDQGSGGAAGQGNSSGPSGAASGGSSQASS